eukprot:50209-Amphidinium_carterae.1
MKEPAQRSMLPLDEFGMKCQEKPEDLNHILFRCPHWHEERRELQLPADDDTTPPCVKLHGLLPAPKVPPVLTHEPVLVNRTGVVTVWTDGSGRHSSDPQHRRCGVGYYTDTHTSMCGLVVSDCKGVVKAIQALQTGRRTPKGRNRDLELRALKRLLPGPTWPNNRVDESAP